MWKVVATNEDTFLHGYQSVVNLHLEQKTLDILKGQKYVAQAGSTKERLKEAARKLTNIVDAHSVANHGVGACMPFARFYRDHNLDLQGVQVVHLGFITFIYDVKYVVPEHPGRGYLIQRRISIGYGHYRTIFRLRELLKLGPVQVACRHLALYCALSSADPPQWTLFSLNTFASPTGPFRSVIGSHWWYMPNRMVCNYALLSHMHWSLTMIAFSHLLLVPYQASIAQFALSLCHRTRLHFLAFIYDATEVRMAKTTSLFITQHSSQWPPLSLNSPPHR